MAEQFPSFELLFLSLLIRPLCMVFVLPQHANILEHMVQCCIEVRGRSETLKPGSCCRTILARNRDGLIIGNGPM